MIIQSKFHDFYDTMLKTMGIDKSVVFRRVEEDIDEIFTFPTLPTYNITAIGSYETCLDYFIFCGKLIPFIHKENKEWFYNLDDIKTIIGDAKFEKVLEAINKDYTKICISYNTPIILIQQHRFYDTRRVTKNVQLSKYYFQKYATPFDCYSKIYNFISGVLTNPEKEAKPISDKLKVKAHSFDPKTSFRKEFHQRKSK